MRKSTCLVLAFLVLLFYGCSFRHMYIIRTLSKEPAVVILTIKGVKDSIAAENWEIAGSAEMVPLKKSKLTTAFRSKIAGVWDKNGTWQFEIPAGWSVDITGLLHQLTSVERASGDCNGSAMEIKYGNSVLRSGNNIAAVQRIFKVKSFFLSGPLVYYLDLG